MNELTNPFDVFASTSAGAVPAQVQTIIDESFAKAKSSCEAVMAQAKKSARLLEDAVSTSYKEMQTIHEQVLRNAETTAHTFFDAVRDLARAKTVPELARLQSNYLQRQVAAFQAQNQELFELSTKLTRRAFDGVNSAMKFEPIRFE